MAIGDNPHRTLRLILIAATVVYTVALIPASIGALRLPMFSEGSATFRVGAFAFNMSALPIVIMVATGAAWVAYKRRWTIMALVAIAVPPIWVLGTLALIAA